MSDEDDYKVGPGRPPLKTRFRKGQSGNLNGRPRNDTTIKGQLRAALFKERKTDSGSVTLVEVIITNFIKDMTQGHMKQWATVISLLEGLEPQAELKPRKSDLARLKRAIPHLYREWLDAGETSEEDRTSP